MGITDEMYIMTDQDSLLKDQIKGLEIIAIILVTNTGERRLVLRVIAFHVTAVTLEK